MRSSSHRVTCFPFLAWAESGVSEASAAAFASFEQKWLAAQPENAFVAIFLPADQRQRASAFGSLVHELEQTAFHVREPQVAATKLAWWRQELADAAAGKSRHPISKALFADRQVQAVDPNLWPAMAAGASFQIELATAASVSETHSQTTSAPCAAALGVGAMPAPSTILPGVRFQTVTSWPALTRLVAMACPIIPRPKKATRISEILLVRKDFSD